MDLTVSMNISRPASRVAAVLCDFARLHEWHPAVESCSADGTAPGALRTYVVGGRSYRDRLINVAHDGLGYVYEQVEGMLPVAALRAFLAVSAEGEAACRVEWSAHVEPGMVPPAAVEAAIASITEAGLDLFRTKLELEELLSPTEPALVPS